MLEKYLEEWRTFQYDKRKIKMAEMAGFNCAVFAYSQFLPVTLQMIGNINPNERIIHIEGLERRQFRDPIVYKIPIGAVRGYHQDKQNLILTLMEDEEPITLQFGSWETLNDAFEAVREFLGENVNPPTPPSSESSESGEDHMDQVV